MGTSNFSQFILKCVFVKLFMIYYTRFLLQFDVFYIPLEQLIRRTSNGRPQNWLPAAKTRNTFYWVNMGWVISYRVLTFPLANSAISQSCVSKHKWQVCIITQVEHATTKRVFRGYRYGNEEFLIDFQHADDQYFSFINILNAIISLWRAL